jgi:hypothetical protein
VVSTLLLASVGCALAVVAGVALIVASFAATAHAKVAPLLFILPVWLIGAVLTLNDHGERDTPQDVTRAWALPVDLAGDVTPGDVVTFTARRFTRRVTSLTVRTVGQGRAVRAATTAMTGAVSIAELVTPDEVARVFGQQVVLRGRPVGSSGYDAERGDQGGGVQAAISTLMQVDSHNESMPTCNQPAWGRPSVTGQSGRYRPL